MNQKPSDEHRGVGLRPQIQPDIVFSDAPTTFLVRPRQKTRHFHAPDFQQAVDSCCHANRPTHPCSSTVAIFGFLERCMDDDEECMLFCNRAARRGGTVCTLILVECVLQHCNGRRDNQEQFGIYEARPAIVCAWAQGIKAPLVPCRRSLTRCSFSRRLCLSVR